MSTPEAVAAISSLVYRARMGDLASDTAGLDWAGAAESRLLQAAIPLAPELGWTTRLVARAAEAAGFSAGDAALLLPNGPRDLAALLSHRHDARALAALSQIDPAAVKIRERIRLGVQARVEAAATDEAAVRRAALFLARPRNAPLALSLAWRSADVLWRWAGDAATDENHYSKRAILAAVLTGTLGVRFTRGAAAAEQFLDARIGNVMAFEKWKAGLPSSSSTLERAAAALGRVRYGRSA